jgi:hypothetical protein
VLAGALDLVSQVVASLAIESRKAEQGVGVILAALQMELDRAACETVRRALPNSESFMGRALMSGARTGEMATLSGPSGLLAALAAAGYTKRRHSPPR